VLDPEPGGNNNGRFDAGETGGLVIALRNAGNEQATAVAATVRSGNPLFVFTDSTTDYGDIPACSTRTNESDPFMVQVDPLIPMETPVTCTLFVNGTGYVDTLRFTVIIGQIRTIDPIPDGPRAPARFWAYDDCDTLYPSRPEFTWAEIAGFPSTQVILGDDQTQSYSLPAGFVWRYYGQTFNQFSVCGNGWVAPGSTTVSTYTNTELPSAGMPPFVALCWDDLYPPEARGIWWRHDPDNHRLIIEYDSVPTYASRTTWDTYELVIYDTTVHTPTGDNVMVAQYLTANGYTSATVGIQDPTGTVAIQCLFDGAYHRGTAAIAPGRAIKYVTADPLMAVAEQPEAPRVTVVRAWPNPGRVGQAVRLAAGTASGLAVYDATGRCVRTIEAGRATWDGTDSSGRLVAPGIYYCRALGNHSTGLKLVLTR